MTVELVSLTWDAAQPVQLARFWAAALGWEISDDTADTARLRPTDGTGFAFTFVLAPGEKSSKNRVHLDLSSRSAEDQRATVTRLTGIGASEIDIGQGRDAPHVVLADPDDNEFCLLAPASPR